MQDKKGHSDETTLIDRRAVRLFAEHTSLDRELEDLANRAETGDWYLRDTIWDGLVERLEGHMTFEESLLDGYAATSPEARSIAAELRAEHGVIRQALLETGVAIQLHALERDRITALVDLLRAHAHRENLTLYPWAAEAAAAFRAAARRSDDRPHSARQR